MVPWVLGSLSSCPPSEGGSLVLQIIAWGSQSSAGHLGLCFSLFARFRPGIGLVFAALGYSMFGVFSGSPSGCECCVLCFRRVDVALQDLPCSSVGGLHCPGPVNARIIAWEIVFNLWGRSGFPGLLGAPHRLTVRAVPVCPRL